MITPLLTTWNKSSEYSIDACNDLLLYEFITADKALTLTSVLVNPALAALDATPTIFKPSATSKPLETKSYNPFAKDAALSAIPSITDKSFTDSLNFWNSFSVNAVNEATLRIDTSNLAAKSLNDFPAATKEAPTAVIATWTFFKPSAAAWLPWVIIFKIIFDTDMLKSPI